MKRFLLTGIALLSFVMLSGIRNWKSYTSTNYIYNGAIGNGEAYLSTWGGVLVFDLEEYKFSDLLGYEQLDDINARAVDYNQNNNKLFVGTKANGVNRFQDGIKQISINSLLGLPSEKVNCITHVDSTIYIATDNGLSVFVELGNFPIPSLKNNYSTLNGLASNDVKKIMISDNYLYCSSTHGMNVVHLDSLFSLSSWKTFDSSNTIMTNSDIRDFYVRNNKTVIATSNGIYQVNSLTNNPQWTKINNQSINSDIFPIYLDSNENIWFSFGYWREDKQFVYDTEIAAVGKINNDMELTLFDTEAGLFTRQITGFMELNSQIAALSWGDGIFIETSAGWENYTHESLIANFVKDMAITSDGKLWIVNGEAIDNITNNGGRGISMFDGTNWENYKTATSPLRSDNNYCIEVDSYDRVWFGAWWTNTENIFGWKSGITVFDDNNDKWLAINRQGIYEYSSESNIWNLIDSSNNLYDNPIIEIVKDDSDNIWIGASGSGCQVFDKDMAVISRFDNGTSTGPRPEAIYVGENKLFIGERETGGVFIWETNTPPNDLDPVRPAPPELKRCWVNDIKGFNHSGVENVFFATSEGLFMHDGENNWFKYGTDIKRKIFSNNSWVDEQYYYIGQTRLYGSILTVPTALFIDPFNRIWIGTRDNGVTVFSPDESYENEFKTYNMNNSSLLSNQITSFAYDPTIGTLYIGTIKGLTSVEIGRASKTTKNLGKTIAYPNPFYSDGQNVMNIALKSGESLPVGRNECRIFDINGDLVVELKENIFFQFSWNGKNAEGKECAPGVYYYLISTSVGEADKGTIVLMKK
ncbi:MAG: hypothetical protein PHR06_04990 [Candidatus Cloacimonetes bacterium]|nr:hypothetical protein [Candidatus Cloacimonadota bacterium]